MKILRVVAGAHRRSTGDHPPCPSHATLGETRGYRGGSGILKKTLMLAVGNGVRNVGLIYRTGKLLSLLVSQTDRKVRTNRTSRDSSLFWGREEKLPIYSQINVPTNSRIEMAPCRPFWLFVGRCFC